MTRERFVSKVAANVGMIVGFTAGAILAQHIHGLALGLMVISMLVYATADLVIAAKKLEREEEV